MNHPRGGKLTRDTLEHPSHYHAATTVGKSPPSHSLHKQLSASSLIKHQLQPIDTSRRRPRSSSNSSQKATTIAVSPLARTPSPLKGDRRTQLDTTPSDHDGNKLSLLSVGRSATTPPPILNVESPSPLVGSKQGTAQLHSYSFPSAINQEHDKNQLHAGSAVSPSPGDDDTSRTVHRNDTLRNATKLLHRNDSHYSTESGDSSRRYDPAVGGTARTSTLTKHNSTLIPNVSSYSSLNRYTSEDDDGSHTPNGHDIESVNQPGSLSHFSPLEYNDFSSESTHKLFYHLSNNEPTLQIDTLEEKLLEFGEFKSSLDKKALKEFIASVYDFKYRENIAHRDSQDAQFADDCIDVYEFERLMTEGSLVRCNREEIMEAFRLFDISDLEELPLDLLKEIYSSWGQYSIGEDATYVMESFVINEQEALDLEEAERKRDKKRSNRRKKGTTPLRRDARKINYREMTNELVEDLSYEERINFRDMGNTFSDMNYTHTHTHGTLPRISSRNLSGSFV